MTKFSIFKLFFLFTLLFSTSCATAPEAKEKVLTAMSVKADTPMKIKTIAKKAVVVSFYKDTKYPTVESLILVRDYSRTSELSFQKITNLLEFVGANPQTGKRVIYLDDGLVWTSVEMDKTVKKDFRSKFSDVDFSILDDVLSSGLSNFNPEMGVDLNSGKIEFRWSNIDFFKFLVKAEKLRLSVPNSFIKRFTKDKYYTYLKLDGESADSPI